MCCIFPKRHYKPSRHQAVNNNTIQATASPPTSKRQHSRLIKPNPLASTKPVQARSADIPFPPTYRSRGSNTPKLQDVTDPATRISLFGPFARIDHHQHWGSGFHGRPDITHHDSGCVEVHGSTCDGNDDSRNSVHLSSACSIKDDSGSGGHDTSRHAGHEAFGHAGADITSLSGGPSVDYSYGGYDGGYDTGGGGGGCD